MLALFDVFVDSILNCGTELRGFRSAHDVEKLCSVKYIKMSHCNVQGYDY